MLDLRAVSSSAKQLLFLNSKSRRSSQWQVFRNAARAQHKRRTCGQHQIHVVLKELIRLELSCSSTELQPGQFSMASPCLRVCVPLIGKEMSIQWLAPRNSEATRPPPRHLRNSDTPPSISQPPNLRTLHLPSRTPCCNTHPDKPDKLAF